MQTMTQTMPTIAIETPSLPKQYRAALLAEDVETALKLSHSAQTNRALYEQFDKIEQELFESGAIKAEMALALYLN